MNETYIDEKSGVEWSDKEMRGEFFAYDVWRFYSPKKERSFLTIYIQSLNDLYKLLNSWNSEQPGIWQYWY